MKTNGQMKGGGQLKGEINGPYYQTWAKYLVRKFIKVLLGPMLKNSTATANLKLMVNDDNRYMLPNYVNEILEDPEAAKYACNGYMPFFHGPMLGSWFRGEAYGQSIIEDMQHWVAGWTDWNLCLDEQGGPNFASNYVDAPVVVNATSDEFYKQPTFYYMGHFSKFIRPGSKRVSVNAQSGTSSVKNLQYIAFTTPNNQRVLALHYRDWANRLNVDIQDAMSDMILKLELEPRSVTTVVWNKP
ncbi:O-glycosyl hydrolase family 30 protein [Aphelenchoides avenae]|nr:O-glycosyl hydrolase family 30 protein [Aphelenchus avenae]